MTSMPRLMSRDVFMNCTNMFPWFMTRPISRGFQDSVVAGQAFVISGSVCFISFATRRPVQKFFFPPERHRHETRHVERCARCRNGANQPDEPAHGNVSS